MKKVVHIYYQYIKDLLGLQGENSLIDNKDRPIHIIGWLLICLSLLSGDSILQISISGLLIFTFIYTFYLVYIKNPEVEK